jgi:hypothetical protein
MLAESERSNSCYSRMTVRSLPYFTPASSQTIPMRVNTRLARVSVDPPARSDLVGVVCQVGAARVELFRSVGRVPPLPAALRERGEQRLTTSEHEESELPWNCGLQAPCYQALAELLSGCNPARTQWASTARCSSLSLSPLSPQGHQVFVSRKSKRAGARGALRLIADYPACLWA